MGSIGGSLGELGERRIYSQLLEPRYRAVPAFGDDCAAFGRDLVVTTDSCPTPLVAELGVTDPYYTGWLLATINLSDLAAAGATPEGLVVNYTLPADTPVREFERIVDGVDACARWHQTRVLGGDISDGREIHLAATAIGRCLPRRRFWAPHPVGGRLSRRGAEAGDRLLLVGSPGYLWGSALLFRGWATLPEPAAAEVRRRAREPVAQLAAGQLLAGRGLARAATDVSDGLYASVQSLCRASRVGAAMSGEIELDDVLMRICDDAKVSPFQLGQTWGDWSLLVAVRASDVDRAQSALRRIGVGVREVGRLTPPENGIVVEDGTDSPSPWEGIDQERFSASSWHGGYVDEFIARMRG